MNVIINDKLKMYIQEKILPEYELNDKGHNIEHIKIVLSRAYELSEGYELDYNMLYTIVCFHDIACHIDRKTHEILSADRLYSDINLKEFFNDEKMKVMKEAIEDHRASLEYIPRNIYGKILSSADRKFGVDNYLKSSMGFTIKKHPEMPDKDVIEDSYQFAIKKFGKDGYAVTKMYVKDEKYENFLNELQYLIENKEEYISRAEKILKEVKEV